MYESLPVPCVYIFWRFNKNKKLNAEKRNHFLLWRTIHNDTSSTRAVGHADTCSQKNTSKFHWRKYCNRSATKSEIIAFVSDRFPGGSVARGDDVASCVSLASMWSSSQRWHLMSQIWRNHNMSTHTHTHTKRREYRQAETEDRQCCFFQTYLHFSFKCDRIKKHNSKTVFTETEWT